MLFNTILNPTFSLFKVKSHAGIAGNERADALAKYQACHVYSLPAETTFRTAGLHSLSKWSAISSTTAQAPFLIKNTLSALKCPPAFYVHSVSKQLLLSIFSQGVNIQSSQVSSPYWMLPAGSLWRLSGRLFGPFGCRQYHPFGPTKLQIPEHASNRTLPS